jgi:hypothetical protein
MTRDETIEAMAREIDPQAFNSKKPDDFWVGQARHAAMLRATAAYDAVVPALLQAEREAMRERCLAVVGENRATLARQETTPASCAAMNWLTFTGHDIRALDIGGQDG